LKYKRNWYFDREKAIEMRKAGASYKEIADFFCCSRSTVYIEIREEVPPMRSGKLKPKEREEIKDLWKSGLFHQREIGEFYGINPSSVNYIIHKKDPIPDDI
jgi:DNA-binding CsgD family transcriptional regulator